MNRLSLGRQFLKTGKIMGQDTMRVETVEEGN
jgi:hypothetical protein